MYYYTIYPITDLIVIPDNYIPLTNKEPIGSLFKNRSTILVLHYVGEYDQPLTIT
jgi:hypothetical protein